MARLCPTGETAETRPDTTDQAPEEAVGLGIASQRPQKTSFAKARHIAIWMAWLCTTAQATETASFATTRQTAGEAVEKTEEAFATYRAAVGVRSAD